MKIEWRSGPFFSDQWKKKKKLKTNKETNKTIHAIDLLFQVFMLAAQLNVFHLHHPARLGSHTYCVGPVCGMGCNIRDQYIRAQGVRVTNEFEFPLLGIVGGKERKQWRLRPDASYLTIPFAVGKTYPFPCRSSFLDARSSVLRHPES
jgi:hypothetical protein